MKVDLIRKYRWYIVGLIMSFIMISVSLSFCLWDDNSLKSLKASGGSGDYKHVPTYKLVDDIYKDDKLTLGKNDIANVGDIVTFGKYYQGLKAESDADKTDLRWIVVDSIGGTLTLLTESVLAFGSFWNDEAYYNSSNTWKNPDYYNQRYNTSTVREWLNSEMRTDGNSVGFATSMGNRKVFNGFLNEAFYTAEQNAIIPRNLGSMKGYYGNNDHEGGFETVDGIRNTLIDGYGVLLNQKVWLPSWTEIYGKVNYNGNNQPVNDYTGDKQFTYFSGVTCGAVNYKLIANTTPFAATGSLSNYTNIAATGQGNSQGVSVGSVSPAWWRLRSPNPGNKYHHVLVVNTAGTGSYDGTCYSSGGVRPAVCLAR